MVSRPWARKSSAVDGLGDLQPRPAAAGADPLRLDDAVAPAFGFLPQDAGAGEGAAAPARPPAQPPRPALAPVAAVTREDLVAALAAEDDPHVLGGLARQQIGGNHRRIGDRIVDVGHDRGQHRPEVARRHLHADVLGPEEGGGAAGALRLVGDPGGVGESGRVGPDLASAAPGHAGEDGAAVDAAREEQAQRGVAPLVDAHAVEQGLVQAPQGLRLRELHRPARRQRGPHAPLADASVADDDRLAGKQAPDRLEPGPGPGREPELQELSHGPGRDLGRYEARGDQRLGLRGEGEVLRRLDIVERLDAERVARQDQAAGARIIQGERVHAAQLAHAVDASPFIKVQDRFTVRRRRERRVGERVPAQLDVIVDLAIDHERAAAGSDQGLMAGLEIDDGQAPVYESHAVPQI